MGAWGVRAFENDVACDWAQDLVGTKRLEAIEATFGELETAGTGPIDADLGCRAVAACEVIARLSGRESYHDAYTESVDRWVASRRARPSVDLLRRAETAIRVVMSDRSELRELWDDADPEGWRKDMEGLRARLSADAPVGRLTRQNRLPQRSGEPKRRTKDFPLRVGDVVKIELGDGGFALAQVIGYELGSGHLIATFEPNVTSPDEIDTSRIELAMSVFHDGPWPVIAHRDPIPFHEPWFISGHEALGGIFIANYARTVRRPATPPEARRHRFRSTANPRILERVLKVRRGLADDPLIADDLESALDLADELRGELDRREGSSIRYPTVP